MSADALRTFVDEPLTKEVSPGMRLRALLLLTTLASFAMILGEWGHGP